MTDRAPPGQRDSTLDEMNQTDIGKIDPSELEPNHGQGNTI